eukprot:TRINITY_DN1416_c0_g1_i1.p2 TRINITY_DN1416_c0_g1~~TRINITY_DN1416_c0_g1_i1.p2  ORF type:complete len:123 (-),score=70.26 TRINITY_DN1416_c0_g1_i1:19-387(-)
MGNSYCGSTYFGLLSLLAHSSPSALANERIGLFSYGSGLAATLFSLRATEAPAAALFNTGDVLARLEQRTESTPEEFTAALERRKAAHGRASYAPTLDHEVFPGTYVLRNIDEHYRRTYERV